MLTSILAQNEQSVNPTPAQVAAVEQRGAAFRRELPIVLALFADGDEVARVELLGLSVVIGHARARVPGTQSGIFDVPLDYLWLDSETAEHLRRAAAWCEALTARPLTARYSAGVQHFGGQGGLR